MVAGETSSSLGGLSTICIPGRRLVPAGICSTAVLGGRGSRDDGPDAGGSTSMELDPSPWNLSLI